MQRVHIAPTLIDAQLASDTLASFGIANRILNTHAAGALGEVPFVNTQPEIWIEDDSQTARAKEVLAATANMETGLDKICPHCGDASPGHFLTCWRCRGALPA